MPSKAPGWFKPVAQVAALAEAVGITSNRFVCGVIDCFDGHITSQDAKYTVVECEVHNARTTHDTPEPVAREQRIIRVQDSWRQHGTAPPPTGTKK